METILSKDGYVVEKEIKNGKPHMTIRRLNESNS